LRRAPIHRDTITVIARTLTGVRDSVRVTYVPSPSAIAIVSGGGQTATVSTALSQPLRVRVTAADALGVKAVAVQFTALAAGASVGASVVATDDSGFAQTTATLGTPLGSQTFQASVTGLAPVSFAATASAGPISPVKSVVTVSAASLASGSGATLTLQGKDAAGNNESS